MPPVQACQAGGKSGHKWGESGKCFTGPGSRAKAAAQGRAIKARQAAAQKGAHLSGDKDKKKRRGPRFGKGFLLEQHMEREKARRGEQPRDRNQYEIDEVRFGKFYGGGGGITDIRERRRAARINRRRHRMGRPTVGPDVQFCFGDLSTGQLAADGGLLEQEQGRGKKRRGGLFGRFSRQSDPQPKEESFSTGPSSADDQPDAGLLIPASLRDKSKKEQEDSLRSLFAADLAGLPAEDNVGLDLTKEEGMEVLRGMARLALSIRTPDFKKIEKGEPADSTRIDPCRLKKVDEEKQIVWGEVYIPMLPDSQGDFMTAEEIEKAAYRFAAQGRLNEIDCMHDGDTDNAAVVVETFIARAEDAIFIEGAWVIGVHIPDGEIWEGVKSGQFNGFSMEGLAVRREKQFEIDLPEQIDGTTQSEAGHDHPYHVRFSAQGEFLGGLAEPNGASGADIHSHGIQKGTITEVGGASPHAHRYSFVEGVLEVAIGRVPPSPEQVAQEG